MRTWRAVRAGLMVLVVVGLAMGGLALAQDPAATDLQDPVSPAAYERILDLLAPLVDDGTLTSDQAAAVADRLADTLPSARDRAGQVLGRMAERLAAAVEAGRLTEAEAEVRLAEARERIARRVAVRQRPARRDHVAEAEGVVTDELTDRVTRPIRDRPRDR